MNTWDDTLRGHISSARFCIDSCEQCVLQPQEQEDQGRDKGLLFGRWPGRRQARLICLCSRYFYLPGGLDPNATFYGTVKKLELAEEQQYGNFRWARVLPRVSECLVNPEPNICFFLFATSKKEMLD